MSYFGLVLLPLRQTFPGADPWGGGDWMASRPPPSFGKITPYSREYLLFSKIVLTGSLVSLEHLFSLSEAITSDIFI